MDEYIKRKSVIDELDEWRDMYPDSDAAREALSLAKRAVRKLPAANVRPVVLCRDCVYAVKGKRALECEKHRYAWTNLKRWVNKDDFCSFGKKREES